MDEIKTKQQELALLINRFINTDGTQLTAIPSMRLIRASSVSERLYTVQEPSLYVIAQGSKIVICAQETYQYDPTSYMIASIHLPICCQILHASCEEPFLGIQLTFTADQILNIMKESGQSRQDKLRPDRGILVSETGPLLLDAVLRLVRLLETPADIPILSPLIMREIFYRVLQGEQSDRVRQFAMIGSQAQSISKVIELIQQNFDKTLRVKALAKEVNMSSSTLYSCFKKITAMSPIQYQKQIRLHEARRLLISEPINAAEVAYCVGYESPSQFSREYLRLFGLPPKLDSKRLQNALN